MTDTRSRILLFAEAVTLAHVARPLAFAQGLDRRRYRVAIACARHAARHVEGAGVDCLPLESIPPEQFLRALAAGRPVYDASTLSGYVQDDLRVIGDSCPDLIVGDFRLSLSVSARLARIPYASIASAYWSPFYLPQSWPVPALPLTRVLPLPLAQTIFSAARPVAFRLHCRPLNAVRRRHGLAPLPPDLRGVYTDADHVLYSDLPSLFPSSGLPDTHRFLGPVLWEPAIDLPPWWAEVPLERPIVYVTLGSSGDGRLLPRVLAALTELPVAVIVATGGSTVSAERRRYVFTADYLPGIQAARRAALMVCNGGSLSAYQALSAGVPVLGIAGNLDQFLNMQAIVRRGAGAMLRADRCSKGAVQSCAADLLNSAQARNAASELQRQCREFDFGERAGDFAGAIVGSL